MSDFTFLTEEQIFGSNQIDVIKKRGTKAAISDFSVLLGGWVSDYHVDSDSSLKGRTGYYWTKSDDGDNDARAVDANGIGFCNNGYERNGGARPDSLLRRFTLSEIYKKVCEIYFKKNISVL